MLYSMIITIATFFGFVEKPLPDLSITEFHSAVSVDFLENDEIFCVRPSGTDKFQQCVFKAKPERIMPIVSIQAAVYYQYNQTDNRTAMHRWQTKFFTCYAMAKITNLNGNVITGLVCDFSKISK